MNIGKIDLLVSSHIDDMRRRGRLGQHCVARTASCDSTVAGRLAALRRTGPRGRGSQPANRAARRPQLRSRVGFALVEAGLHLQATAGHYHADRRMASE